MLTPDGFFKTEPTQGRIKCVKRQSGHSWQSFRTAYSPSCSMSGRACGTLGVTTHLIVNRPDSARSEARQTPQGARCMGSVWMSGVPTSSRVAQINRSAVISQVRERTDRSPNLYHASKHRATTSSTIRKDYRGAHAHVEALYPRQAHDRFGQKPNGQTRIEENACGARTTVNLSETARLKAERHGVAVVEKWQRAVVTKCFPIGTARNTLRENDGSWLRFVCVCGVKTSHEHEKLNTFRG